MTKWILIGSVIIILMLSGALKWVHSKYIKQKVQTELFKAKLNGVNKKFTSYITDTETTIQKDRQANRVLQNKFTKIRMESNELQKLLAKHDLNRLAKLKPNLISQRVNASTERVWKQLSSDSTKFSRSKTNPASTNKTP